MQIFTNELRKTNEAKELYHQAFPRQERFPWLLLKSSSCLLFLDFLTFFANDQFVGMAVVIKLPTI